MAVYLSPFGGAGIQFFDNSGDPLTGGKIYSYAAGTTTPQATYTTYVGNVAHTNPIILDAAGRVPSGGEIWLLAPSYKFILKNANDVTIATYDDIAGIGSQTFTPQNFTGNGSTVIFTLTFAPNTENATFVYINGVYQQKNTYTVAGTTLTFSTAPPINSSIEVMYN